MKYLPLIWSNLGRRKLRTGLTLLCVVVAFILYGYLAAIARAFDQGASVAGADRLIVRHRVSLTQLLPESYLRRLTEIPGVSAATHATWFGGIYKEPRNFFAQLPVQPAEYLAMFPEFLLPPDQLQAWLDTRTGAIAGRKTAEKFGWTIGDRIPIRSTIWSRRDGNPVWEFDLVGIYDGADRGTDTTTFLFRYDYFREARAFGSGLVGWYQVRVANPDEADEVAARIDATFANSTAETKAETEGAFVRGFAKQIGDIGRIMVAVLSAVFFTILLVAGNTMAQAVRERAEELGVLKALGFTNGQVLGLVLAESCLIANLGGLAGLGIAVLLIAGGDPTGGALPIFYLPDSNLVAGIGLTLVLGIAAGILPAWQACRLGIAEALRRM